MDLQKGTGRLKRAQGVRKRVQGVIQGRSGGPHCKNELTGTIQYCL